MCALTMATPTPADDAIGWGLEPRAVAAQRADAVAFFTGFTFAHRQALESLGGVLAGSVAGRWSACS
jgi:hypothetical protein